MYWYGGSGNWSDYTNHWSNNSGNSPASPASNAPTSTDDAIFDVNSASDNYTVTINATANCANFTMDKPTGGGKKVTWAGSSALNIYGNLDLVGGTAGITLSYTGGITFKKASGTATITSNSVVFLGDITFNQSGTTFRLVDNLNINGSSKFLILSAGTFDATTNSAAVILGGLVHYISGSFTFYNLTRTGSASTNDNLILYTNITVSNTLTINGNSAINRILVKSNTLGTARTITTTGGSVVVTNCDFQDITATGDAGDWDLSAITGGSGDCGGNTGITFTTADDWYWHQGTGNVNDYTKWYTATNGGGSQMASTLVPLPQDTLHFDSNSFDSGSQTVTQNMPRIGSIDWTGATNTPTYTYGNSTYFHGSITLINGMTFTTNNWSTYLYNRGNYILTTGTKTFDGAIQCDCKTGSWTLGDNLTTTKNITISSGTFSVVNGVNNYIISTSTNLTASAGSTLALGSQTHIFSGNQAEMIQFSSTSTITGTYTLKFTGTLTADRQLASFGAMPILNNIWIANSGAYAVIIISSFTCNDFKIDAGRTVKFTNSTNTTVTTFTALGTSGSHIILSNTSGTTHATLTKAGGGVISGCDYVDSTYLTGSPDLTWYMGANSTNTDCTNMYTSAVTTNTTNFFNYI